ncbi:hypothetical protein PHYSODRAFT_454211, partial [Phytophthora sojae]
WRGIFKKSLGLRPTRRDPNTHVVTRAVCMLCVNVGRETQPARGRRSRGPPVDEQFFQFPWRVDNIKSHHLCFHPRIWAQH